MELNFQQIKQLKVGDVILEYEGGSVLYAKVITEPKVTASTETSGEKISFKAINIIEGDKINYLFSEEYLNYCPQIYRV